MRQTPNIHLTPELKISDVILNNPYLLLLLEHFGIYMPVQDKSLNYICEENNLNIELVLIFANLYNGIHYTPTIPLSFDDTSSIIKYLKNSHKFYSDEVFPKIQSIIKQMTGVNTCKEMSLVQKFFIDYFNEVIEHFDYENNIVFPYVLELYGQIDDHEPTGKNIQYSVMEYKDHHHDIQEKLNDLKNLLIKYLPHKNDYAIRRKLLFNLSELEYDLNIHSKIEDLILIPLVAKMESYLSESK